MKINRLRFVLFFLTALFFAASFYTELVYAVPLFLLAIFVLIILFNVFVSVRFVFLLFPFLIVIYKIIGKDEKQLKRDIIDTHNEVILRRLKKKNLSDKKILFILPHCLQNSDCEYKVTWDKLENCRQCGKCLVPEFIKLKQKMLDVVVVTGGTAAREIIKERRPDVIIAVACEDDLYSGIKDVGRIPVIALLNERPFGPCRNTTVDMDNLRDILDQLNIAS